MMYKALGSIGEVPYCFSKSFINLLPVCYMGQKLFGFLPELSISRLKFQFEFTKGYEMMHKALSSTEEVLYFSRSSVKFQCQGTKNLQFQPALRVCGLELQFEFTDGFYSLTFQAEGVLPLPASVNPFISDSVTLDMLLENDRNFGEVINGTDIRPDWTHLS